MSQFYITSSGSTPTPPTPSPTFQTVSDFDDFLGMGSANPFPKMGFRCNHVPVKVSGTANNPGILQLPNGIAEGNSLCMTSDEPLPWLLGGGTLAVTWIVDLVALSDVTNTYAIYIGISDTSTIAAGVKPQNGVWFEYTDGVNSGKWQIVCGSGGVYTATNTSITATTGFNNFTLLVNSAGTSVSYKINGVTVGTVASNIPSVVLGPSVVSEVISNDVSVTNIDLFWYEQTLTNSRD